MDPITASHRAALLRTTCSVLVLTLCAIEASARPMLLQRPIDRAQVMQPKALDAKPGAPEQALFAPFPRAFELTGSRRHFEGFAVSKEGPIQVALRADGAPLLLTLRRPDGRLIEKQGQGEIVIEDMATGADLAAGSIWNVAVSPLRPGEPSVPVARGQLSVKAPAADMPAVMAEIARAQAKSAAASDAMRAQAPTTGDAAAEAARQQRALDQATLARHATLLQQLQPQLAPETAAVMQQSLALRAQGRTPAQAQQAMLADPRLLQAGALNNVPLRAERGLAPGQAVAPMTAPAASPAAAPAAAAAAAAPASAAPGAAATSPSVTGAVNRLLKPGIATPPAAGGQTAQSGQGAPVAPQGRPVVRALSVGEGDPGTPVMLTGTNLGDQRGQVRFIVANGMDLPAPVTHWTATQIVLQVPAAEGIGAFNGHVYVRRPDGSQSDFWPFSFRPTVEVRTLHPLFNGDATVHPFALAAVDFHGFGNKVIRRDAPVWGGNGRDEFFKGRQLKNGWKVERCFATPGSQTAWAPGAVVAAGTGDVSVSCRAGSQMLDTSADWWLGWGSRLVYSVGLVVSGPKGLAPL